MPRIAEFYGILIYMYFSDHAPPHFHAIYGQHEAEIEIPSGEVIKGHLPKRALLLVREWAAECFSELLLNWDRARNHEALLPIPPLS